MVPGTFGGKMGEVQPDSGVLRSFDQPGASRVQAVIPEAVHDGPGPPFESTSTCANVASRALPTRITDARALQATAPVTRDSARPTRRICNAF